MNATESKLVIEFKGKVRKLEYTDGTLAARYIDTPAIKRHHVDIDAFRRSRRFGHYANSDLFAAMLARDLRALGIMERVNLLKPLPSGVTVDESGFLAAVRIELQD